ncbi:Uncharacterized protein TCM_010481 [Theobroma cacao]|uniref:Uncharacterized protein n=1 Tax=Theobroma cacao TaxID=3641 RepID=A0A061E8A2_THECC|nr:Uncharacterized protein TCM_010481 [Theobroma cacao]
MADDPIMMGGVSHSEDHGTETLQSTVQDQWDRFDALGINANRNRDDERPRIRDDVAHGQPIGDLFL